MLRDYQVAAVNAAMDYIAQGNPIIEAAVGAGKTHMIAELAGQLVCGGDVLVVSDYSEIVLTNYKKLRGILGEKVGLYKSPHKVIRKITVAQLQTIYRDIDKFKHIKYIIIDEAHRVNHKDEGMFRKLIKEVGCKVIGFTATPFRSNGGYLHKAESKVFDKIVYKIDYTKLLNDGWLCLLKTPATKEVMAHKGLKKSGDDYTLKSLSETHGDDDTVNRILTDALPKIKVSNASMVFAIDIKHATKIYNWLKGNGVNVGIHHSKVVNDDVHDYKTGKLQCIVSVAALTTGFDAPQTDLLVLMRTTRSRILYEQILGRGARPVYADGMLLDTPGQRVAAIAEGGKPFCTVLDYAGCIVANGAMDYRDIGDEYISKRKGEAPVKVCPGCSHYVFAGVKNCPYCNHEFTFNENLRLSHSTRKLFEGMDDGVETDVYPVIDVHYGIHQSRIHGGFSFHVRYFLEGHQSIDRFYAPGKNTKSKYIFFNFIKKVYKADNPPYTIQKAYDYAMRGLFIKPHSVELEKVGNTVKMKCRYGYET